MNAVTPFAPTSSRTLDIDLVGDFTCPWSWLGLLQVNRALQNLQGEVRPRLRWHPLRTGARTTFRDYLAERLPHNLSADFAERSLADAGEKLGAHFHFDRLPGAPDTTQAHRLAVLAAREERQADVVAAIFRAYFERAENIAELDVLVTIARGVGLTQSLIDEFVASSSDTADVARAEERLSGFGVRAVPNLLFNGRVLVPGAVDVNTYVAALDQALFPVPDGAAPPRLQ
jgi:predicted DsbA family dithiol-disulfide isomerase